MKKKLLLDLADHMEAVEDEKYDQDNWLFGITIDQVESTRTVTPGWSRAKLKEGFCGTSACVLGHAAFVPSIKKAGLFIALDNDDVDNEKEELKQGRTADSILHATIGKISAGVFVSGFDAGMDVFDIPYQHAELMFQNLCLKTRYFYTGDETMNPTSKHVAAALRKYVETDGRSADEVLAIYDTEDDSDD